MSLKTDFGKRLKELRTKNKITQEKLAELVGVDVKHISHIETGRSFPKADLIEKFANAMNIDYKMLFDFKRQIPHKDLVENITKLLNNTNDDKLNIINKVLSDLLINL